MLRKSSYRPPEVAVDPPASGTCDGGVRGPNQEPEDEGDAEEPIEADVNGLERRGDQMDPSPSAPLCMQSSSISEWWSSAREGSAGPGLRGETDEGEKDSSGVCGRQRLSSGERAVEASSVLP